MSLKAKHTIRASYIGYLTQAVIINFCPLLFVNFMGAYGISLTQISLIIALGFTVQLIADLIMTRISAKINIRATAIAAHALAAAGLILLAVLPEILPSPFIGIVIACIISSTGGGIIEVLVSPIVEACPTTEKSASMSILHSFYCWGFAGMVLLSAVYFRIFGIGNWHFLAVLWALVPLSGVIAFSIVPLYPIETTRKSRARSLFKNKFYLLLLVIIFSAGAAETIMAQWASSFAESGLGISKALGDILGPFIFAVVMGITRVIYAKFSKKISLMPFYVASSVLCAASYITAALSSNNVLTLIGCAFCGISVGVMWPGAYSLAAEKIPGGGVNMFAFLAMAGDLGCVTGPLLTGAVAQAAGNNLRPAFITAVIFPAIILICFAVLFAAKRKKSNMN